MLKNIIIAHHNENIERYIKKYLKNIIPHTEITVVTKHKELKEYLEKHEDTIVYVDKFFLGFFIKERLGEFRAINKNVRFVFVDEGSCPIYFGIRIHRFGVKGFICGTENPVIVRKAFINTVNDMEYFPEKIENALNDANVLKESRYLSDITKREYEILKLLHEKKSNKEIAAILGIVCAEAITTYIRRIKEKTGNDKTELEYLIFISNSDLDSNFNSEDVA